MLRSELRRFQALTQPLLHCRRSRSLLHRHAAAAAAAAADAPAAGDGEGDVDRCFTNTRSNTDSRYKAIIYL